MSAKRTTFKKKSTTKSRSSEEQQVTVSTTASRPEESAKSTGAHEVFGDQQGMIMAGGVEIIGLLGLVTLVYATLCLYLMY